MNDSATRSVFGRLVLWAVCLCAIASPLAAQEAVNYASVSGQVTDPGGAAVSGAAVVARQIETNISSTATTDRDGRFRFAYLRVGPYEITAREAGFADTIRRLTLTAGAAFNLPLPLSLRAIQTTVDVTAEAPIIESARSQIAGTVDETEVRALPLNGRNALDLALLVPGVSPTNVGGGTQLFPETSAVPGVGISVGSQRNLSNNFIVDGLSANDDAAGLSGMTYAVDAIDQLQVITSGGQAELGRALGGYVNVVTKSGTNALRGEVYNFMRDSRLNSPNALSGTKLPMRQYQYGGSVGGPIIKGRTFYFANAEQRRLDQSGFSTIATESVPIINARLATVGYRGPGVTTGVYPNPIDTTNIVAKLDHQVNDRNHVSFRYSAYSVSSENARGAGGLVAPSASSGLDNTDRAFAVGHIASLSPRVVVETRAQYAASDLQAPPTDAVGPAVTISNVATFGTISGAPTARRNVLSEVASNLSYQAGAHAIRSGVDVLYNDLAITFPRSVRGSYTFSSLSNFLNGTYGNNGFTQTFGVSSIALTNPNLGVYVQDEWKAHARLTVNAGLRYDLQLMKTIATDTDNIAPRLGIVWTPDASQRAVVRASAGLFHDRVPLRAVANALLSAGNTTDLTKLAQTNVSLSPTQAGAPVFPNVLSEIVPTVTLVNFTTIDRNLQNAYSRQAAVEYEQQLGASSSVSVGYQHLRGLRLIMAINQNVPTCAVSGTNNGCRPNPNFQNNSQYSSTGESVYDGLHVSFVKRQSRWGAYRVSYTYSRSLNNVGEAFFNGPIDPADLSKDWGRSDDDQRHRLTMNASFATSSAAAESWWDALSHGFQLSGVFQYYSALPFNVTVASGVNTIQGTPARPLENGVLIPRNAGIGSPFSTTGLRLTRAFPTGSRARLEATAEVFNVFNRRNDLARVTTFGTGAYPTNPAPNFGQVTVVGEPRTFQFGLRFRY